MSIVDDLRTFNIDLTNDQGSTVDHLTNLVEDFGRSSLTGDNAKNLRTGQSIIAGVQNGQIPYPYGQQVEQVNGIFNKTTTTWEGTKYAEGLVKYAPKPRFIFKVQFIFNSPYDRLADSEHREFMYVIKQIDKPKVNFEYEDINMYNFRTKVLRTIRHEPLSMAFHDDIQNKVVEFFDSYRRAYSPVSSIDENGIPILEDSGMNFSSDGYNSFYSASMGPLRDNNRTILKAIKLYQVYGNGSFMNTFIFLNPKIDNFDFDNLDHDSSEGNVLSVNFSYDALYIVNKQPVTKTPAPVFEYDFGGNTDTNTQRIGVEGVLGNDVAITDRYGSQEYPYIDPNTGIMMPEQSSFPLTNQAGPVSSADSIYSMQSQNTLDSLVPNVDQAKAGISTGGTTNSAQSVTSIIDQIKSF